MFLIYNNSMRLLFPLTLLLCYGAQAAPGPAWAISAEQRLEAKLNQQLEAVLGPGKAHVTVSGRASASRRQVRSLSQSQAQVLHERSMTESRQGQTHSRSEKVWGFEQTESLQIEQPEALEQKSVSVIYELPAQGEDSELAGPVVDPALIEGMIRTVAQLDESRGDQLQIRAVRMDTSAYERLRAEMEKNREQTPVWLYALCALGGVGSGLALGFLLTRRRAVPVPAWEPQTAPFVDGFPSATVPVQPGLQSKTLD